MSYGYKLRLKHMPTRCGNDDCDRPLEPGDHIVHMGKGQCFNGHITPAFTTEDDVIGEWHRECFREFPLNPQSQPYRCEECGGPIQHGQMVTFVCIGYKAPRGQVRPERRGNQLYLVRHSYLCART